ncbi:uncharacterized protein LOC134232965 [Saccostrea cucullata]|uniref:uncharacterized protein LOC134232965 n=1 Tax=Saccostrea cuccullata TaxID=36930 RepID=UPI002ECFDB7C
MEVNYKSKWYLSTIILIQTAGMLNTLELKRGSTLCKYNFYFDHQWMDCMECPWGSFGLNCSQQCITGFYGRLCVVPCGCNAQHCHPVNGCQTNVNLKEQVSTDVPVSSWLETSTDISTLKIVRQSEPSLDMSTLKMDNSTSKLSSPSSVSDGPTVQGHRRSTQPEAPTSTFDSASSEKSKKITVFATSFKPTTSSSKNGLDLMLVLLHRSNCD